MTIETKLGIAAASLVVTLAGCGSAPQAGQTVQAQRASASGGGKAAAADEDGGATIFGCKVDSDCVAIEDDTSCFDGALVAVNQAYVDDYCGYEDGGAVDCSIPAWSDTRVAQCDFSAHTCQMIDPTLIHCGGFINPSHACPDGFHCDFHGRVPDVGGSCVADDNSGN